MRTTLTIITYVYAYSLDQRSDCNKNEKSILAL